ncbi:MAG TPA: hypothetical protein VGB94_02915 [Acidobacteriaceae bacterium]
MPKPNHPTRHATPIARPAPEDDAPRPGLQKIAEELHAARKGKLLNRGTTTLRKLSHKGHRY